jgi:hypothetical protein
VLIWRRRFLLSAAAVVLASCARPTPRPAAPTSAPPPDADRWNQEALGILSDVLQTLRTFDSFQAFRVSTARASDMRQGAELAWDPPTSAAWDEATHVTRGLRGRADQLLTAVATARIVPNQWRDQRAAADAMHDLLDLGESLSAYRDRIENLPPGDASSALGLLDKAWSQWAAVAAHWNVSRSEAFGCAA